MNKSRRRFLSYFSVPILLPVLPFPARARARLPGGGASEILQLVSTEAGKGAAFLGKVLIESGLNEFRGVDLNAEISIVRSLPLDEISNRSQMDFNYGRVVEIDGWVLSRTEAFVCMLSAAEEGH